VEESKESKEIQCPYCGSVNREGERMLKQMKADGYIPEDIPVMQQFQIQPVPQQELQKRLMTSMTGKIKIKMMVFTWDVCSDCHGIYCTKPGEALEGEMQMQMPQSMPGSNGGSRHPLPPNLFR
jgi:hypothetical protein